MLILLFMAMAMAVLARCGWRPVVRATQWMT